NVFQDSQVCLGSGCPNDQWAIVIRTLVDGLWISDNRVSGDMQLVSGGGAIRNAIVTRNHITGNRSSAISFSTQGGQDIENMRIADNVMEDGLIGIFLGPDGATGGAGGALHNVAVTGNLILNQEIGILFRAEDTNSDIVVANNTIHGHTSQNSLGIR